VNRQETVRTGDSPPRGLTRAPARVTGSNPADAHLQQTTFGEPEGRAEPMGEDGVPTEQDPGVAT
jgi:hypothetical protein